MRHFKEKRAWTFAVSLALGLLSSSVWAETVEFTNRELQAALLLLKPDRTAIELDGRTARFTPSPSLKFLGVPAAEKKLDLSFILDLVDLRFERLQAGLPELLFQEGELKLILPIRDNPRALRSLVGSAGCEGLRLVATLEWEAADSTHPRLRLKRSAVEGKITGHGVLAPKFVIQKITQFALRQFNEAAEKLLSESAIREGVENGLLKYGEFSHGEELRGITPGTLRFFSEGPVSGIRYSVE